MKPKSPVLPDGLYNEIKVAENDPKYQTLPVVLSIDGVFISRWELSDDELKEINEKKSVFLMQWTNGGQMQPILPAVFPPEGVVEAPPPPPPCCFGCETEGEFKPYLLLQSMPPVPVCDICRESFGSIHQQLQKGEQIGIKATEGVRKIINGWIKDRQSEIVKEL